MPGGQRFLKTILTCIRTDDMSDLEKKTFSTQEGSNRGRDKPGSDKEPAADPPKPKTQQGE